MLVLVAQICNPSTQEADPRGLLQIEGQPEPHGEVKERPPEEEVTPELSSDTIGLLSRSRHPGEGTEWSERGSCMPG